jgi:hypothetical protein
LIPVVISNVRVMIEENNTEVSICWDTNIDTIGNIKYGLFTNEIYSNTTPMTVEYKTKDHCQKINNLVKAQNYIFNINAIAPTGMYDNYENVFTTGEDQIIIDELPQTGQCITIENNSYAFNSNQQVIQNYQTSNNASCILRYANANINKYFESASQSTGTRHQGIMELINMDGKNDIIFEIICNVQGANNDEVSQCTASGVIPVSRYCQYTNCPEEIAPIEFSIPTWLPLLPFTGAVLSSFIAYPRWLLYALAWIKRRRNSKPWGIIYDGDTKKPIIFASVKLMLGTKFVKETVTDTDGKFGFVVNKGDYIIKVDHPEYDTTSMPIQLVEEEGIVAEDIALSKRSTENSNINKIYSNWRQNLREKLLKINTILVTVGFIMSIIAVIFSPILYNIMVLCFYIAQFAILYLLSKMQKKQWGYIYEEAYNSRISGAFIRIFDITEKKQIDVQIADELGRYGFSNIKEGEYDVLVSAAGYNFPGNSMDQSKIIRYPSGQAFIRANHSKSKPFNYNIPLSKVF